MDYQSAEQIKFMNDRLATLNLTDNPSISDIFSGFSHCVSWYYFTPLMWEGYRILEHGIYDIRRLFFFKLSDLATILVSAVLITFFRMWFESNVCLPFMNKVKLTDPVIRAKCPESMFKTFFYGCTWIWCAICLYNSDIVSRPSTLWDNWYVGMEVPLQVYMLLMVECGFYVHSLYATIFMDFKRKDYTIMLIHHCVSSLLIGLAYAFRYHMTGLLVLFLHDINDVFLESTKILKYMHRRNGQVYPIYDVLSSFGFATFTISWIITRTYLFLYDVLYGTLVVSCKKMYMKNGGNYMLMNSLLLTVFVLDLYWLYNITLMLIRIVSGRMKELEDIREDQNVQITNQSMKAKLAELNQQNGFIDISPKKSD